jgi:hypothetical protein
MVNGLVLQPALAPLAERGRAALRDVPRERNGFVLLAHGQDGADYSLAALRLGDDDGETARQSPATDRRGRQDKFYWRSSAECQSSSYSTFLHAGDDCTSPIEHLIDQVTSRCLCATSTLCNFHDWRPFS